MAKPMEHPIRSQIEVIPVPYVRQKGSGTLTGAYRCNFCARVELSERKIILHLYVNHGIRKLDKPEPVQFARDIQRITKTPRMYIHLFIHLVTKCYRFQYLCTIVPHVCERENGHVRERWTA